MNGKIKKSTDTQQAVGYATLASVVKCLQADAWLVACGNQITGGTKFMKKCIKKILSFALMLALVLPSVYFGNVVEAYGEDVKDGWMGI